MITTLRVVFDVVVRMRQFIELVDGLITFEASLLHQMQVVDVNDGLIAKELLRELAVKRVKNHLQNVFLAAALS